MAVDFLAMLNEQKEQEKASKKQKEAKGTVKPEKEKKPEKAKSTAKKEVKKKSFDEQYTEIKNSYVKVVVDHLLSLDGMREKMEDENVSIDGMWNYIQSQARKKAVNGCAIIADEEVYSWGRHYYDEHGKVA